MATAAGTPRFGLLPASALLAGIGACLVLPRLPPWPVLALAFAVGLGLWLHRQGWPLLVGAALLGAGLAGLHAAAALAQQLPAPLEGREFVVVGRIVELPVAEPRRTRFLFRVDGDRTQRAALRGRLLRLAWYDDDPRARALVEAGGRWRLQVRLRAPRGLRNPGASDGEKHAMAQRIAATGYVRHPQRGRRLAAPTGLDAWRERMARRIAASSPDGSLRFVRALALGDTRGLGERDWELLRANGLTHLIAISGFHVGLVAGAAALLASLAWWCLPALGRRVPRPHAAAVAAVIGALAYTAVAGFALPTVRTALMIAVVVTAQLWRRPAGPAEAFALAAIFLLAGDPLSVLGAGFWLSFAGVAWLLWCLPRAPTHPVRGLVGAQAVATIGLLPLTVVLFGQASLAGPLANLVAVPWWSLVVVPLSLLGIALEALCGAGGVAWRLAAQAFDLAWPLFEWLGGTPLALWWLPEARWVALPLALAGAFWLLLPRGVPGKPLALLLWLPLLWPARAMPQPGDIDVVAVDVGQGLAVVVRTARHALLYDAGPAVRDGFDAGERAVVPALHALGVRRIDMAVVSHADNDHAGGWPAVARVLPAPRVAAPEGSPTPATHRCRAGDAWEWDGVRFRVLHPTPHFPYLRNESSCVLQVVARHGRVLLTGDIGEVVERDLVRREGPELRSDVVLVAHHGSDGSSDPGFVAATAARVALVSTGAGNRFGHPKPIVAERWCRAGADVLDTADSGALRVRLHGGGVEASRRRATHARLWDAAHRRSGGAGLCYREHLERPDVPED